MSSLSSARCSVTVVVVALCLISLAFGAPSASSPVHRSSDEATASSYFYFSRSPGHSIQLGSLPLDGHSVPHLLTESARFYPVVKSVEYELDSGEEEGDEKANEDDEDDEEEDQHHGQAYRVVEHGPEETEESKGSAYGEEHHQKKGEKGVKGYDSKHKLEKGSKGSYGKEDHEHQYGHEGDRKHSHHDEGSHYHDHHAAAKRTKGGKHHEKKHHKKGSKTTGYHNVYHKDEYKKEHIFYDTADHQGQFRKYGSAHQHHADEAGKKASGGHEDRAHQDSSYKKEGSKHQGKYDEHHADHKHHHGQNEYEKVGSAYGQKHGHQGAGERGYKIIHQ
ncbi:histidine-rich glycoprotein-like [Anopheles aquasalis]|uniref:histidine-rich glycoprotein-like n=1 Tax=Anopheles aquasalis TaxID=42839 RepID=UPI00215A2EA3|nr:histidine-rich glycoprotein-like [Anopheles aquasalis]